jgi:hypothetical protein
LNPNQWEVTYINQAPKWSLWNGPAEWGSLFRRSGIATFGIAAVEAETFSWTWHG